MLDSKFVRDNVETIRRNIEARNVRVDLDGILSLYDHRGALLREIEALRARRNRNAAFMRRRPPEDEARRLVEEGKRIKEEIVEREEKLKSVGAKLQVAERELPNLTHPDAPTGHDESANREVEVVGSIPRFDFNVKDHVQLAADLGIVDFEAAAKVSGTKFYYLKNQAVYLELALIRFALDLVAERGYAPLITPDIARTEIVAGIGYNPRGSESNIYNLEGEDTSLIGTAEITLGGFYADTVLDAEDLPIRMAGISHCFRREAGASGQFSRGLYRVHQFTKVEMFIVCHPDDSEALHEELIGIEKMIFSRLRIPFRVLDICSGDLGGPAYRKFDLEAWMPGRGEDGEWGEITSASNCTDYQSRRLNIRYRKKALGGETARGYVHLLNGTAIAVSRAMIAILENFQREDGSVDIPPALQPYTGFDRIVPKR